MHAAGGPSFFGSNPFVGLERVEERVYLRCNWSYHMGWQSGCRLTLPVAFLLTLLLARQVRWLFLSRLLVMLPPEVHSNWLNTPEGKDPFDRMRAAHIALKVAGENLALAQTLSIAHTGLMHSPGHRANILNPAYHRVGIGIIEDGVHGLTISQEFRD